MSRVFPLLFFFVCAACFADDAVIGRYKEILIKSPKRGATFDRVYGHYVDTGQSVVFYQDCQKATQDHPTDASAWILLGLVAERRNQGDQAVHAFQTAAQLEPNNYLPAFYLGELLLNQRRTHEAIAALEQATERLRNSTNRNELRTVLQTLALAYERFGNAQKSSEVWNQLSDLFPNDPDILVQVAEAMELEGKQDEALNLYRRLIRMTEEPAGRVQLSLAAIDIMLRQGNDASALNDLDLLLGFLDTESYLADAVRDRIDRIFSRANDPHRQIEFYQKRIEQEPNDIASLRRLVRTLQKMDKSADAEKLLHDAIKKSPANVSLRQMLIDILTERKDIDGAVEQFQALDKIVPNKTNHLFHWGTLVLQNTAMTETSRRAEAANVWHRIAEKSPNDPVTLVQVAELFARNRFLDEAERYYKAAFALRPKDFAYREYLAMFYHQQRLKEKVVETLPLTLHNKAETGQLLLTMEYFTEAAEVLREAVQSAPQDWTLLYRYLEALLRQGNFTEGAKIIIEAEQKITDDEQYALFLQQEVQLLKSTQRIIDAIRLVQECGGVNPHIRPLWHLAALHQGSGNFSAAIAAIAKIPGFTDTPPSGTPERPQNAFLRFVAELYEQSGNTAKAIALYQKLVKEDPSRSGNYWQQIITLQIQRGELPLALESSQQLLGRGTENAERLRFIAELFLSVNRRTEAVRLLQQALVYEPGNTDVLRILAQTYTDADEHEEAIELLWRLYDRLEHVPAKLSVIDMLANSYSRLDRNEDLVERLRQLSRNFERRREAMQALTRVFILGNDLDEAQMMLETLLDMPDDKEDPELSSLWTLRELVMLSEKQQDMAAAIRYQETICQRVPDLREQDILFRLYNKTGDTEKSKRLLFDQVLRHINLQDRLDLIDSMIQREQYESAAQVLDFLDIHEPERWEINFRQIMVNAYQGKPVENMVKEFRAKRYSDSPTLPPRNQQPPFHEHFIFSNAAPDDLNVLLSVQNLFLPTLFHQEICNSGRAPEQRPVVDYSNVQTLHDARILVLGWLLREALLKDIASQNNNPAVMRQLRNTVETLRDMFPLDSEKHDVLLNRLRLEVWLLDFRSSYDLSYYVLNDTDTQKSRLQLQIDERTCQQTVWQIVRKLALDDSADWQPALFQILTTECINELVTERFKGISESELAERLPQILDNLCKERKTPPIPAEERNRMINQAAFLVKQSSADHRASLSGHVLTLEQKTNLLLSIWAEYIESASPETRKKYASPIVSRCGTFFWILRSQNRIKDADALELSLQKTIQSDPLWFADHMEFDLNPTTDTYSMLFPMEVYDSVEERFNKVKTGAVELLPFQTGKEEKRAFCDLLFAHLHWIFHGRGLSRYAVFTPPEQSLFEKSVSELWHYLQVPSPAPEQQLARQLLGAEPYSMRQQILDAGQMDRLAELNRSLRQIADFAFWILNELEVEPDSLSSDGVAAPPEQKVALLRYRAELQGERPVDRSLIYALVQNTGTASNAPAVDDLFRRILLLRRALDTKKKFLRVNINDTLTPIEENYTEQFAKFLTMKKGSTSAVDRAWSRHIAETFSDLLNTEVSSAAQPVLPGLDSDLSRIVGRLETAQKERALTPAEQMALILLYIRMQRFNNAVTMLDSMELSTTELWLREWIIAHLAMRHTADAQTERGSAAAKRLLDYRLSAGDSLKLVPVLQHFQHYEEAQQVLDYLTATVSDHRMLAELFYKMNAAGDAQKENVVKIAQRILLNPTFLQNTRRLTSDVYLMEETIKTLRRQNRVDTVMPMLENRLKGHRNKTDSRILLARLYLQLDRRDDAKALALELAQNPTDEPERRQMVISLLVEFNMQKELEMMNRLLLERR